MAGRLEAKRLPRRGWMPPLARRIAHGVPPTVRLYGFTAGRAARIAARAMLDLALPPSCVGCGRELDGGNAAHGKPLMCDPCLDELAWIDGPACVTCAAPLPAGRCVHCRGRRHWFHAAIAAGRYTGRLRQLLLRMKRAEGDRVSLAMGRLVWDRCDQRLIDVAAEVVAPVPMHWRRRFLRGTNSAAVLAEALADKLQLPLRRRLLRRRRYTRPQFSLSPPERRANVRGAFSVGAGYPLQEAHVLLVDDIMTSGATCNEAARTLRKAGARRVTVVVAARAGPN